MQADGQILERGEGVSTVMFADAAVVFAVRGVARKMQFFFDAPMTSVEGKKAVFVRLFRSKAGYTADDFPGFLRPVGSGSLYFEDLCGEGEVDPAGRDGGGDDAAGDDISAGFVSGAVG